MIMELCVTSLPASTQTLSDYLKTQEEDKMCTSVSIYCQKGWPERKNEIATELRPYWNACRELTVDKTAYYSIKNELLFQSHSRGTLEKIHSGHQKSTKVQTMSKHSSMVT